jgi:hypothetical protein
VVQPSCWMRRRRSQSKSCAVITDVMIGYPSGEFRSSNHDPRGLGFFSRKWVRSLSSDETTWSRVFSLNLNLYGSVGRLGQIRRCHSGAPATFSMYAPLL